MKRFLDNARKNMSDYPEIEEAWRRLWQDYMPFEFTVTLFKDDTFMEQDTVFSRYKNAFETD